MATGGPRAFSERARGWGRLSCCVCVSSFQCVCDTFSAALDGLEVLLALDAHPR